MQEIDFKFKSILNTNTGDLRQSLFGMGEDRVKRIPSRPTDCEELIRQLWYVQDSSVLSYLSSMSSSPIYLGLEKVFP